ncbi:MAG: AmmeMemoRadiSam system radical SAM enzyme [Deltaproteobacteria bacterium]|nr:AmmeMemoRadiSam system radical SAM enzyme [Deltaproteobacteria bacterium]
MSEKEAMLYRILADSRVNCYLCSHRCDIAEADQGLCGTRANRHGKLFTSSYGEVLAARAEPIERSHFYHVVPGTKSFSVAVEGSNLPCTGNRGEEKIGASKEKDRDIRFHEMSPRDLIKGAVMEGCKSLSFAYSEPTLSYEYAYETARLAREEGILNILFTNGYMTPEALRIIAPYLDACSVEIRSSRDDFYRNVCGGNLEPVLECIRSMKRLGIWVEVSTTIKPGLNDGDEDLEGIARFISDLDRNIPWHIARGYPDDVTAEVCMTSLEKLWKAYSTGKRERLRYIYIRNILGEKGETICPHCAKSVICRRDFLVEKMNLADSRCSECGQEIAGIFATRPGE